MYYIKFEEASILGGAGVWVRNKRKNENIEKYRNYLTKRILNKIAKILVKEEEQEEFGQFSNFEYQRKLRDYKLEYRDVAAAYANITLGERYFDSLESEKIEELKQDKKRWSFKNVFTSIAKKIPKKNKNKVSAIHDELLENYSLENEARATNQEESHSIHDEIIDNFDLTYQDYCEMDGSCDYELEDIDEKYIEKYPVKEVTEDDILTMNVYSGNMKKEVASSIATKTMVETKKVPGTLGVSSDILKRNLDVDLENVSYPIRRLDCGNGMIQIFSDEFRMLIESKYNAIKEDEEAFKKLAKTYRESFEAYYKKQVSKVFDYSKKGKITISKDEYDKLLETHNHYFKLCTIRREKEELQRRKDEYIEKMIQKAKAEAESKFQEGEKSLDHAEATYTTALEKVIKK